MPRTKAAASGVTRQPPLDPQCDQRRATTTGCFPLPPKSGAKSQPDPASKCNQHARCFAEAEITAPTPHIRSQLFHCRLDANTLGSSRDLSDSMLEPIQSLWRNPALDVWTSRETVSRPAGLHHQPLAELCVTLSRHTAPIRRTYRSYRAASARKASRFPELVFQESDSHEPCEL
jgi:hypothetical protein